MDKLFQRLNDRYILAILIFTRLFGSIGGMAVIYYVELTLNLPSPLREHFRLYSAMVVVFSCTMTVLVAAYETRTMNSVLRKLRSGVPIPAAESMKAGREAATFVKRHHLFEAWFVPCSTLVPDMLCLRIFDNAPVAVLTNLTVTVFMGIAMALMSTYFVLEYSMKPVISHLLDNGVPIDFASLPAGKLRRRFGLSFALIILTTALMIGTLARQRATDIIMDPRNQEATVQSLRTHSLAITVVAVAIGIVYSTVLADSVASRAGQLIDAMSRVAKGQLSERLQPTGNDEIDVLARHFNVMVRELEHNDHTIRDLNVNLQDRVRERTAQLESTIEELRDTQSQLTDVAHRAGMAEVATGVLHNVGNVLNSVNISVALLTDQIRRSKLSDLESFTQRLADKRDELPTFLSSADRATRLVEFLEKVGSRLSGEHADILSEIESLAHKVEHIKGIINAQQAYARQMPFHEKVQLHQLFADVIKLHNESLQKHDIDIRVEADDLPSVMVEKAKLLQVIENLIKNAIESIVQNRSSEREVRVVARLLTEQMVQIAVSDTGGGIHPDARDKLFRYGFTTKPNGNGFGLHASALAVSNAGGRMYVESEGIGQGATFFIELPLEPVRQAEGRGEERGDEHGEEEQASVSSEHVAGEEPRESEQEQGIQDEHRSEKVLGIANIVELNTIADAGSESAIS